MTTTRLVQNTVLPLILGLAYLNIGHSQESVQNRLGVFFTILITQSFSVMLGTVHVCKYLELSKKFLLKTSKNISKLDFCHESFKQTYIIF